MKPLILSIETSTKNCSVCVSEGTDILALIEEHSDKYIHSEKLHIFIEKAMAEAGLPAGKARKSFADLDAVAVGKGPGSYTGLRIGVSAAKGFCFALNIPLIAENGLEILVNQFLSENEIPKSQFLLPMIDARRMEVYTAVFDFEGKRVSEIEAKIVDEETSPASFLGTPSRGGQASEPNSASKLQFHFFGDGAEKCREILDENRFIFSEIKYPSAKNLAQISLQKFEKNEFENVAYFEPFYLKNFVAGKKKKSI